ncbi:S-adenosylmethionine:tRNA ribosyltransferase-isomerase [Rhizobium bangladeshense]|uniref:S-adenosylmethionine:tRNA ribosyltransferase-isomerase n=1 Tax=Rhizobium bangladeshense TaxID=1138189 RepID=A0ABS7LN85_9HYPH|nr:S-adenosylmethionine:tRNA ribosyltransferase-isomerase [Rhizobium bangladeshense]MBX4870089.1 S-adenosylmethionine:tRNA ribosyltransferase-isomerase [Rhizobium bangladeshense]MBX4886411.1 S-adenosylmethionine:tRNA ribosyltransferase-isomerase [Rhizobium bangladeshense]MBY3592922.1 S-adenosylmethionine:tRNA ribosyltransferase-isomerase [Rhizobium bangladeshense]
MIAVERLDPQPARLLVVEADGTMSDLPRAHLGALFEPGDLVVANDAATLPASLHGTHLRCGKAIEIRLAGWLPPSAPVRFLAIAFGSGDHRTRTEDRLPPPALSSGDRLQLGPLEAVVERVLDHPRFFELSFQGTRAAMFAGLAQHGRPIQYAHVPEPLTLWDVWTRIAARPVAFEAPSASFALDWRTLQVWRRREIGFATLTHAAGISSTGDPALDSRLPFDEPYHISESTVAQVARAQLSGSRIIAIGTSVVRALEAAANPDGSVRAGDGIATGRIARGIPLRVVDAVLTGVHQPGESHFELLRAFADDALLAGASAALTACRYRAHEFGDSMLLNRQPLLYRRGP